MTNNLDSKITAGLERIAEVFKTLIWEEAKLHGLSPIQIQILIFIQQHSLDLANVSYLAKEFNLTKPTISDAVRVLLDKKMIQKNPSLLDKRAYSILLTKEGKEKVKQMQDFAQPLEKIISKLPTENKMQFFTTLTHLIHQLNRDKIITVQRMCFSCIHYDKSKTTTKHFCNLLQTSLLDEEIRLDCAEFREKI